MADGTGLTVGAYEPADLETLHRINEAAVPFVNSLTRDELSELIATSPITLVVREEGQPLGFVLTLLDGLDYDSLNYAWVSSRYPAFSYVDRVAIDEAARGRGLGRMLYDALFPKLGDVRDKLLLEVNLEPPNPASHAFHAAMGFERVGERWSEDRAKSVAYYCRPLS